MSEGQIVKCVHCKGTGTCTGYTTWGRDYDEHITEFNTSCADCLEKSGNPDYLGEVDCSVYGGSGKICVGPKKDN